MSQLLSEIRPNYASSYSKNAFIQFDAAKALAAFASPTIEQGKVMLDVGCGSGKVSQFLFDSFKPTTFHAIDQSPEMIQEAQAGGYSQDIAFKPSSIEEYSVKTKYDFVFSNSSFQWFSDYEAGLAKIRDHLNPDGAFFIQSSYKSRWCPEFLELVDTLRTQHSFIDDLLKGQGDRTNRSKSHFRCYSSLNHLDLVCFEVSEHIKM